MISCSKLITLPFQFFITELGGPDAYGHLIDRSQIQYTHQDNDNRQGYTNYRPIGFTSGVRVDGTFNAIKFKIHDLTYGQILQALVSIHYRQFTLYKY